MTDDSKETDPKASEPESPARSDAGMDSADRSAPDYRVDPVPRLPHKLGWRWAFADIVRIVFLGALLVMVIVARKPCSDSVANFVDSFSEPDAAPAAREMKLERLTEEQIKERFGANDIDAGTPAADGAPSAR